MISNDHIHHNHNHDDDHIHHDFLTNSVNNQNQDHIKRFRHFSRSTMLRIHNHSKEVDDNDDGEDDDDDNDDDDDDDYSQV